MTSTTVVPSSANARRPEPTSLLPLRWGTYRGRYLAGLALIVAGTLVLDGSNTYTTILLLLGTASHTVGWLILPARGMRRVWLVGPCVAAVWILLIGPKVIPAATMFFLAWLIVRARPAISYLTLIPVLGVGILIANIFTEYSWMPLSVALEAATLVVCAWLARFLAGIGRPLPRSAAHRTP